MFLLRIGLVIAITSLVTTNVDAQLFRFRRSAPQQTRGAYNAQSYQYTRLRRPVTNVPSQRYAGQRSATPNCNRSQVVYTPVTGTMSEAQALAAKQNGQVVMLTLRDPQTGQTFQQPYIMTRAGQTGALEDKDKAASLAANDKEEPKSETVIEKSPEEMLSKASSAELLSPVLEDPRAKKVARTSFESPVLDSEKQYSVLDTNEKTEPAAPSAGSSVLESSLPILEAPTAEPDLSNEPGSIQPESSGDLDLDIDLPPLRSKGSN